MQTVPPDHELAERAYRLAAALFDLGLTVAVWGAVTIATAIALMLLPDLAGVAGIVGNLALLAGWGVLGLVQWSLLASAGTTLGKRVVGIRIVRDGQPPGFVMGVLVRRLVPRIASLATFGLVGLVDVVPVFAPDRRAVHDRIAGTFVVLDPQAREGDAPVTGRELWVARGVRFAHVLAVWSFAVAALFAAIVLQNLLVGFDGITGGWVGTFFAGASALALAVAGASVYDGRPVAVIGVTVVAVGTMGFAGLWFAYLSMFVGAVSALPWIAAGFAGQLAVVAGLFVQPASRIAAARQELHERAMLDEMGIGASA